MANNRTDISTRIVDRLKTVSALHNNVLDYQPGEITAFPLAVVTPTGYDDQIADTARNLRIYNFDVTVYLDRGKESFGTSDAERVRRELEDSILTVFDNYQDLGNNVLWCRVFSGGWGYAPDNSLAFFTLLIQAYKAVDISSA